MHRYTPNSLEELPEGSVFVFGSNAEGNHIGGAAKTAQEKFGAVAGRGSGHHGQSYAIPTMNGLDIFSAAVRDFLHYADTHPALTFYVTKVGCGIAGYEEHFVKKMFAKSPANVIKPERWDIYDHDPATA